MLASQPSADGLTPGPAKFLREDLRGYLLPRLGDLTMAVMALDEIKPELVILHNDVEPVTRAAALWAKVHDVACLHVPHAVYMDVEKGAPGSDVHDLITASHLAAAGPFQRAWYERRGFPPGNVRETGLPQFDAYARLTRSRKKARHMLRLDPHRPVVVYASSWAQGTNLLGVHSGVETSYLEFLEATKKLPDVQPVVKTHPRGDNVDWHVERAKEAGVACAVTPHHLEVVLRAADAILAYGPSNVLLEAAFVPGLRLLATHGYPDDGAVKKVDGRDVAEALHESLTDPAPDTLAFRVKYVGPPDGRAWERIAAFAEELLA
jgi:hypothetical protein